MKDVLSVEAKAINFKPTPPEMMAYNEQQKLSVDPSKRKPRESEEEKTKVWVYEANGAIVPQEVTLGASDGVNVQILSGINEGDRLVYSLKSASTKATVAERGTEESPFMPQRPGGKKK
ncbi:hypothetical protein Q5W13_20620 [Zobellia laminariae]|nr:hypothetical protein [Zobellia laminariae]WKX75962.1 hypothetical protein Q5W13_20620 [Zobellia laminariae]